jgi:SNF2 family DNA or RNA helicase
VARQRRSGKLHDFQVDGVAWLRDRWQLDINCILADEMGLGKTIQSIGYLVSIARHTVRPALIVVPLSTLQNWYAEFARWAPQLNVVTFCGNQTARDLTRTHEFWFKRQRRKKGESDDDTATTTATTTTTAAATAAA